MKYKLVNTKPVIHTHDDLDPWVVITVGYNEAKELVFELSYYFYDDYEDPPQIRWYKYIVVEEKDVETLCQKMHTTWQRLPEKCMYTFGIEEDCWEADEVYSTFNAIQHYLSGLRIHYRLEHEGNDNVRQV